MILPRNITFSIPISQKSGDDMPPSGDVIQRALAQLAGGGLITPVAFSFGWVTYSISALLAVVGENKLLPVSDCIGQVINVRSRYTRQNNSWILGRVMRDFSYWRGREVREAERGMIAKEQRVALCVAVYEADPKKTAGVPDRDWVWYSGLICAFLQLGISIIPWILLEDWTIFSTTACGICLALGSGAFSQWRQEKGNGQKDCIVIIGGGVGLGLEDLAGWWGVDLPHTRYWASFMAALWIALLIAVSGLKHNTWFLLVVGVLGIQNIIGVIIERKVMEALKTTERKYPYVGRSLVDVYFPGGLRPDEQEYWKKADDTARSKDPKAK
ncbi:hypothetical protein L873DRAFT_1826965 [Choiromyces venosus 120613-1]|uniref:Uncharacterized protein n=1 Tax=Choiromyces venosus 120613-1 TaxID=1336337 RepID=A0A3N4JU87_9PEZI|nr:hypothetical protein L873DRAFT_1826965 [Choiromyces venosus 120613-1]